MMHPTTTETMYHSRFSNVEQIHDKGPFAIEQQYQMDESPLKVNLTIGAYRDDDGQPWPLTAVTEAKKLMNAVSCTHEYLPLAGDQDFLEATRLIAFGPTLIQTSGAAITSIQTVSGTGANSLIAIFLQQHSRPKNIWISDPTWINHFTIWKQCAPDINLRLYPYYKSRQFDFESMMKTLQEEAQFGDAILLHACAHNPTGLDPSKEQWKDIAQLCQEKNLFVIFDSAYQGFATGDLDRDVWAVRYFLSETDIELALCQSFSKNLGLYGERVGALHVALSRKEDSSAVSAVQAQLMMLQRGLVSMAPRFGSHVAKQVFSETHLRTQWEEDLKTMSGRIKTMRYALYNELVRLKTPGDWEHIMKQTGMFSYTGLSEDEVTRLRQHYHIYLLPTGRASVCGLTTNNVLYVAGAVDSHWRKRGVT